MSRKIFTLIKFCAIPIIPIAGYKVWISYNRYSDNPNVLTGYEFNKKFKNVKFYTCLNWDSTLGYHKYKYKNGINTLDDWFNPTENDTNAGLYFWDEHNISDCICNFGGLYSEVSIPNSAYVYIYMGKNKYKATKIKLKSIENRSKMFYTLDKKTIFDLINSKPYSLGYAPDDLKTKELCELAVYNRGLALDYVPIYLKTKEICMLAVSNNGLSLEYVPNNLRTNEICEVAVQKNGLSLEFVPDNLKTYELCKSAINSNELSIKFVPNDLRTEELCKLAVQKNGLTLEFVPQDLKTKELCKLAINQNPYSLQFVSRCLMTKELCELAIHKNGLSLRYVPEDLKTKELCEIAVNNDRYATQYVKGNLLHHFVRHHVVEEKNDWDDNWQ